MSQNSLVIAHGGSRRESAGHNRSWPGRDAPAARLGRRPLQERARLLVDRLAEKVVGARVADVELDRRIELQGLDEIAVRVAAGSFGGPCLSVAEGTLLGEQQCDGNECDTYIYLGRTPVWLVPDVSA